MDNKQTAVEWLQECLLTHFSHEQIMQFEGLFQQAKAMEKQQINNAWDSGIDAYLNNEDLIEAWAGFKKYYKKTYG